MRLPLDSAYRFGEENGLDHEMNAIRDLQVDRAFGIKHLAVRRGMIVELLQSRGLFEKFKEECWPDGDTPSGRAGSVRYLQRKRAFEDAVAQRAELIADDIDDEEDDDEQRHGFAAESHLRDFLAKNPTCIEPGLTIYQDGERNGIEFTIKDGRIDMLAKDKNDNFVVVELKRGRSRNRTIGQLLYYMGWVDEHLGNGTRCRGIIIANDISKDLLIAIRRAPDVELFRYNVSFTVEVAE